MIMGYTTKNEVMNFRFADAEIFEIKGIQEKITFELGYVTILGQNSCNRDIREMGTNALTLDLMGVEETTLVKEGFKVFDADGNPKSSCEDEVIPQERYKEIYKELENSRIYDLRMAIIFFILIPKKEHILIRLKLKMTEKHGSVL
jgi:hypothetical protein